MAETIFDHGAVKRLSRVGLPDRYIECGVVPTLQKRYGLTTDELVAVALGGSA